MKGEIKLKSLLVALGVPLALGGLAAFLTAEGMALFRAMPKPPLAPPAWLFPAVWTILYILMGTASYLVWVSGASPIRRERALSAYALNLAANFLWPFIFFAMELYLAAFIWLILLWAIAAVTALMFWYISQRAGKLMLPYLVWLGFAAYLNFAVWLLSR